MRFGALWNDLSPTTLPAGNWFVAFDLFSVPVGGDNCAGAADCVGAATERPSPLCSYLHDLGLMVQLLSRSGAILRSVESG